MPVAAAPEGKGEHDDEQSAYQWDRYWRVALDKFDPALGTLTKVTIKLEATTDSGTIDWDNEAAIPTDVTLGIGAEVTATAPLLAALVAVPLQLGSATGVAADNDGAADFIGTDSFSVTGGSGSDDDEDFTTNPADFPTFTAGFVGDTFDTTIDSVVTNYLSTTGGFGPIQQTPGQAYGTITVTYHYIPEPATLSLLALSGLGLLLRRKRS
ncbi:MAG: choice-of-anchor E domain-containing protein [Phycisphaerae bacterium]|nr:choice-of-anchor E domain-containing protein [Phycisphaerae bacterium]